MRAIAHRAHLTPYGPAVGVEVSGGTMFRAYDLTSEWMGPARESAGAAWHDANRHNTACHKQGGYGRAVVVQPDPEAPDRCVDTDGNTVWPPHGRTSGAVRWQP